MHIAGLFENITIKDLKPPKRSDIVKRFVDKINADTRNSNEIEKIIAREQKRKPMVWKSPLPAFIAVKMSHLSKERLWMFLGYCSEAKHFSKCWWWSLANMDVWTDKVDKIQD